MNAQLKVMAKVEEVKDKLEELGYARIDFYATVTRLKPGRSGEANYSYKRIQISSDYLREHEEQVMGRTVPHEVVHMYVHRYFPFAKQAHGPEFRRLMRLIKCDCSTRHDMRLIDGPVKNKYAKARFVYLSEKTSREIFLTPQQHQKMQTWPDRFTSKNGERLVFANRTIKL